MANRKAAVTQAEMQRYLRAMRAAGYSDLQIEVVKPDGTVIRVVAGKASETAEATDDFDAMIERIK